MGWLSLFTGLLKLANLVLGIVQQKQLMDAGAKMQLARDLAELAKRGQVADQVSLEIDKLTDADLDEELRK
jgi:hypothetical protein